MPALQHVYLTAHGTWGAGSWANERAQIGCRLAFAPVGSEPAKGSTFTLAENGDIATDTGTEAGTHGTLTRTWKSRIGGIGSPDNMDAAQQVDLAEDFWTFLNSIRTYQGGGFSWTHVKIAPILADGAYGAPSSVYQFTAALAGAGAAGNQTLPPEVALAVSFRAPVIGRTGRGRMYLPAMHVSAVNLDGTVHATATSTVLAAGVTLVGALENLSGIEEVTPVFTVTSAGKSTGVRPSQVRVGSHFDAQRRRQQQQPEVYTSTSL